MPNLDTLAESYYADRDPQFANDEMAIRADIYEKFNEVFESGEETLRWIEDILNYVRSIGENTKRLCQASNMISDALGLLEEERTEYEEFSRNN